tara:strand:- start:770 stop:1039 length:270 start_codon:yes stop_codon:yes gene_type:complete
MQLVQLLFSISYLVSLTIKVFFIVFGSFEELEGVVNHTHILFARTFLILSFLLLFFQEHFVIFSLVVTTILMLLFLSFSIGILEVTFSR